MPQDKDRPPSMFNFCGKSVEDTLNNIGENFLSARSSFDDYLSQIERCKMEFCSLPAPLHSLLVECCLKAANKFAEQCCSDAREKSLSRNQFMIQPLVSMIVLLKTKEVDFEKWSQPVQISLLNFLWRMTHLKSLKYCSQEKLNDAEVRLVESLPFLMNLTHFSSNQCTDAIVAALCENCEHLEEVDLQSSEKVTDKSIDSLISCKKLRRVNFLATAVTGKGLVKFLLNIQSKNLVDIGEIEEFGEALDLLETEMVPFRTFQLHSLQSTDVSARHVPIICKCFPLVQTLFFYQEVAELPDFSCLDVLKNLENANLIISGYSYDNFEPLYSLRSQVLTSLYLYSSDDIDLQINITNLISVGLQCPNLVTLELDTCSFYKDANFLTHCTLGKPFQKLKKFSFHSSSTVSYAELILRYAYNIENIVIGADGVTDAFLNNVIEFNSLKQLKSLHTLYQSSVSSKILKYIIVNCESIMYLGRFAPSDEALLKQEFESLQKFIIENEYKVLLQ